MRPDINPEISVDILNKSMHIHKVTIFLHFIASYYRYNSIRYKHFHFRFHFLKMYILTIGERLHHQIVLVREAGVVLCQSEDHVDDHFRILGVLDR
jgi:hypothetical protein